MKRLGWYTVIGFGLVLVSVVGYAVQVMVFHRASDTGFYLLQDLAFLPIQVLLVSLVINGLLRAREQMELEQKMSMVIGIFFTQMGNDLLRLLSGFDKDLEGIRQIVCVQADWRDAKFTAVQKQLEKHKFVMDCRRADVNHLKQMLVGNSDFLLELLANPSLLEHGTFTEILWSVSHLTQELALRPDLDHLPTADYEHLDIDMRRAYEKMVVEWLSYLRQLKAHHPYMYSLVVRMNPFLPNPSPIIQDRVDAYPASK